MELTAMGFVWVIITLHNSSSQVTLKKKFNYKTGKYIFIIFSRHHQYERVFLRLMLKKFIWKICSKFGEFSGLIIEVSNLCLISHFSLAEWKNHRSIINYSMLMWSSLFFVRVRFIAHNLVKQFLNLDFKSTF